MYARCYVNKKITKSGGGDHVRVIDLEADDLDAAAAQGKKKLRSGEELGDVVELRLKPHEAEELGLA